MTASERETRMARRQALVRAEPERVRELAAGKKNFHAAAKSRFARTTAKLAGIFDAEPHFVVRRVAQDTKLARDLHAKRTILRRTSNDDDQNAPERPIFDPDLPPDDHFAYARTAAVGVAARDTHHHQQQVQVAAQSVRGPLPAAAELNAYNAAAPNAAD